MLESIRGNYVSQQPIVSDLAKKEVKTDDLVNYGSIVSDDDTKVSNDTLKYDINAIKDNSRNIKKQPIEVKIPENLRTLILQMQIQQLMQKLIEKLQELMGINKKSGIKDLLKSDTSKAPFGVEIKKDPKSGNYYATRPDTKEFKEHDEYMEKMMALYDLTHPKKDYNPNDIKLFRSETIGLNDDLRTDRQKYYDKLEAEYRKNHPEYDVQATYYEAKQEEAQKMNKPRWITLIHRPQIMNRYDYANELKTNDISYVKSEN